MKYVTVYHYDAFTLKPNKGNPAGLVLNGDELSNNEMQEIAYKVGFNETAFLVKSDKSDFRIRYFTPGQEMNLCGHATIAMIYALKTMNLLMLKKHVTIETKVGILGIKVDLSEDNKVIITMKQAAPQFEAFKGSKKDLVDAIGINEDDLEDDFPILYGSTGAWTLLVPVNNLEVFKTMKPNNSLFPTILNERSKASIHPFCFETYDPDADMHARHFSSPYSGTIEDAVTGTASGIMGVYFTKYKKDTGRDSLKFIVEQGHEINKDGRVLVNVSPNECGYDVEVAGSAVYVNQFEILLEDKEISN
ncbi:isomerase [Staphylococcus casei]|uniref:PhzF family phenazine biosynthesis isomerase n=1 Tax=Staphylococcus TaxID=1279 RepID=UPI000CCFEC32|nr:PhzF family phenazine biosynthesis isomerase [Staphylococcus casei]PNZ56540.1 isomerase [Staphylococcus casei]WJE87337.1 PhzF family phenazine biosynthesis isomerase [Staphylococcus casei]